MKRRVGVSLFLFLVAASLFVYTYTMISPYRISAEEAKARLREGTFDVVLDVRTKLERDAMGYYPNSMHIPSGELQEKVEGQIPRKDSRILVYCNTGQRARQATDLLRELGYTDVKYIASGHTSLMD
jgi:phage shock protein E